MTILYVDESILVCIKPYHVLSQCSDDKNNVIDILYKEYGTLYPVHRLDKTTGGVMVYARNSQSAAALSKQIIENLFSKTYIAKVEGCVTPTVGEMCDLLYFDRKANKSYVVKKERNGVKKAKLSYEVLEIADEKSLVKVKLQTGRTHQIRVQFSSRGYPLVGDRRYGSKIQSSNINLWSYSLEFNHPKTNKRLIFEHNPPEWV